MDEEAVTVTRPFYRLNDRPGCGSTNHESPFRNACPAPDTSGGKKYQLDHFPAARPKISPVSCTSTGQTHPGRRGGRQFPV